MITIKRYLLTFVIGFIFKKQKHIYCSCRRKIPILIHGWWLFIDISYVSILVVNKKCTNSLSILLFVWPSRFYLWERHSSGNQNVRRKLLSRVALVQNWRFVSQNESTDAIWWKLKLDQGLDWHLPQTGVLLAASLVHHDLKDIIHDAAGDTAIIAEWQVQRKAEVLIKWCHIS